MQGLQANYHHWESGKIAELTIWAQLSSLHNVCLDSQPGCRWWCTLQDRESACQHWYKRWAFCRLPGKTSDVLSARLTVAGVQLQWLSMRQNSIYLGARPRVTNHKHCLLYTDSHNHCCCFSFLHAVACCSLCTLALVAFQNSSEKCGTAQTQPYLTVQYNIGRPHCTAQGV